jgi:hypothetical protein
VLKIAINILKKPGFVRVKLLVFIEKRKWFDQQSKIDDEKKKK